MKFKSHCKINLFLHITGKRPNGYHELQSLFYFPEIYDEIEFLDDKKNEFLIDGKFARDLSPEKKDNLIFKAYSLLKILFSLQIPDLSIKLTKNLPVASGIGGGSANAATILRELNNIYGLHLSLNQLYKIGMRIGADVPACILSQTCLAEGIGEIISPIKDFPKLNILLVNPLTPVSISEIFKMGFNEFSKPTSHDLSFLKTQSLIDFLESTKNDLEVNAKQIAPQITEVLNLIEKQPGCLLNRMSGSGATCFGIFETSDAALIAKENISKIKPGWWVEAG